MQNVRYNLEVFSTLTSTLTYSNSRCPAARQSLIYANVDWWATLRRKLSNVSLRKEVINMMNYDRTLAKLKFIITIIACWWSLAAVQSLYYQAMYYICRDWGRARRRWMAEWDRWPSSDRNRSFGNCITLLRFASFASNTIQWTVSSWFGWRIDETRI